MQQSAQQPPVAMYVVHYVQGNQDPNQPQMPPQVIQQPLQQQMQPMWGAYPQPMQYNGMPVQFMPYPTYIQYQQPQQTFPATDNGAQTPQQPPQAISDPSPAEPPRATIPGPVQPLMTTNKSPGPPTQGVVPEKRENSLAEFAMVASMQSANEEQSEHDTTPETEERRQDSKPEASPKRKRASSKQQQQDDEADEEKKPGSTRYVRPYKRRNFPVKVDICLPPLKLDNDDSIAASKLEAYSPPRTLKAVSIPGLPDPPKAVTDPVQVPVEEEEEAAEDPKQEEDELDDEDVMWMEEKDPTKRRKRSSNVFDEVLTMNPLYTAEGFVCPECNKVFKFRKHCRRHMVNHSGSKPFKCPKCPRSYTRKDTCQRHAAACRVKSNLSSRVTSEVGKKEENKGTEKVKEVKEEATSVPASPSVSTA